MTNVAAQTGETLVKEVDNLFDSSLAIARNIYHQLPTIVTRLMMAGLVILAGTIVLRILRKLLNIRLRKKNIQASHTVKQSETVRSLFSSIISYLMYFLIIMTVLRIFGVDISSLLAVAGIGSIAIGFPTMLLRPMTTASFPVRSMPVLALRFLRNFFAKSVLNLK